METTDDSAVSVGDSQSWESINNMLIQNRCWLCQSTFQKGKLKKVFMVSQLLDVFEKHYQNNLTDMSVIFPRNMQHCYFSFVRNGGKVENVVPILTNLDMAPWMSGLVCTQNEECGKFHDVISSSSAIETLAAIRGEMVEKGIISSDANCPPGCGCDNPWAFLPAPKSV